MITSIKEANIFTALRAFILTVVPAGVEVIRSQVNRVAMPKGDFVSMTPLAQAELEIPTNSVNGNTQQNTVTRPTQYTIQLDCYGATASDNATMLTVMLRDDVAFQALALGNSGFDLAPLYVGDVRQMPLTTGEDSFLERWTFDCVLQANPAITVPQQTMLGASVATISVDRAYH